MPSCGAVPSGRIQTKPQMRDVCGQGKDCAAVTRGLAARLPTQKVESRVLCSKSLQASLSLSLPPSLSARRDGMPPDVFACAARNSAHERGFYKGKGAASWQRREDGRHTCTNACTRTTWSSAKYLVCEA